MDSKYGILLTPDIKLHRGYFREMVRLLGIQVLYYQPKDDKTYTEYTELISRYEKPLYIGCIFDEHPTQQTLKKIGWFAEGQESASLIHVDYDLPGLQQGALFAIPSGLDDGKARLFRVIKLENGIVYPASMMCMIVPEYETTFSSSQYEHNHDNFNLLSQSEGEDIP